MNNTKRTDGEELQYQAENYDQIPLWSSARGNAVKIAGFMTLLTLGLTWYTGDLLAGVINTALTAALIYLVATGKKWAMILMIGLYSISMLVNVYGLIMLELLLPIIIPIFLWLWVCRKLSDALGVEQRRGKLSQSTEPTQHG